MLTASATCSATSAPSASTPPAMNGGRITYAGGLKGARTRQATCGRSAFRATSGRRRKTPGKLPRASARKRSTTESSARHARCLAPELRAGGSGWTGAWRGGSATSSTVIGSLLRLTPPERMPTYSPDRPMPPARRRHATRCRCRIRGAHGCRGNRQSMTRRSEIGTQSAIAALRFHPTRSRLHTEEGRRHSSATCCACRAC